MSHFFDVSSESDVEVDEYIEAVVDTGNENRIDPKWYEVTDGEEEDVQKAVISREEKLQQELQTLSDTFDFNMSMENWVEAEKNFNELVNTSEKYLKRYGTIHSSVLECLENASDLSQRLKPRQEYTSSKDLTCLRRLIKSVEDLAIMVQKEQERLEREAAALKLEEENTNEDEVCTIESIAEKLQGIVVLKGKRSSLCNRLVTQSKRNGFTSLLITALGVQAEAVLEEDTRLAYIANTTWERAFQCATEAFALASKSPGIAIMEDFTPSRGATTNLSATRAVVTGGFARLARLLFIHSRRIAQFIEGSNPAYFAVVRMENDLVSFTDSVFGYYTSRSQKRGMSLCAQILMDILGPRRQEAHDLLYPKLATKNLSIVSSSVKATVMALQKYLLEYGDEETRFRSFLHLAYQLGLAGSHREARDLLLRTNTVDVVEKYMSLSILYDRVIAILGLAAFSSGDVEDSFNLLSSLWSNRNHETLICQRLPEAARHDEVEELKYRDLIIPPHLQIQNSQLQLATMVSTLIVDTVNLAKRPYESSRHQSYFYGIVNSMSYVPLAGVPMDFREQVFGAYQALKVGDFKTTSSVVRSMDAWSTMPTGEQVFKKINEHLKAAALRIFCYNNRRIFTAISVSNLSKKYELSDSDVRRILNDIISENNTPLIGFWDSDDMFLNVDPNNASRLQHLVEGAAESVGELAQYAERRPRDDALGRGGRGAGRGRGGRGGRGGFRGGRGGFRGRG